MTATVTLLVDGEARRRVAKLRARAYVGPTPGVVAVDHDDAEASRIVVSLPNGNESNARALAGHVLAPGERAAAIVAPGSSGDAETADDGALGSVYQGRDGGGVQRLAAELGDGAGQRPASNRTQSDDGGDAGSDARAAIRRQFGIDAASDATGLSERLARDHGDDFRERDELHFFAQQLAFAADPDTDLALADVRGDPETRVRDLVAASDDDALAQAVEDADWTWLASLAADRTTRPPVAYEPDNHDVN